MAELLKSGFVYVLLLPLRYLLIISPASWFVSFKLPCPKPTKLFIFPPHSLLQEEKHCLWAVKLLFKLPPCYSHYFYVHFKVWLQSRNYIAHKGCIHTVATHWSDFIVATRAEVHGGYSPSFLGLRYCSSSLAFLCLHKTFSRCASQWAECWFSTQSCFSLYVPFFLKFCTLKISNVLSSPCNVRSSEKG